MRAEIHVQTTLETQWNADSADRIIEWQSSMRAIINCLEIIYAVYLCL